MLITLDNSYGLRFSHYDVATGWTTLADLPGGPASLQSVWPTVGMDGSGNAFVSWLVADTNAVYSLNVLRYDHATHAWGALQHPDTYTQTLAAYSQMSVSPGGEVLVLVYHRGATGTHDVYAHHYSGTTWTAELVASEANNVQGTPIGVRIADTGAAAALWQTSIGWQVATRAAGAWTAGPALNTIPLQAQADVAVNGAGDAFIGYQAVGTPPNVYMYDGTGKTWSGPNAVSTNANNGGACNPIVMLTATGDGNFTRCYTPFSTGATPPQQIESFAYVKSTKTWGAGATVKPVAGKPSAFFSASYDSSGNALVAFIDDQGGATKPAVSSSYTPAGGWTAPTAALGGATASTAAAFLSANGRGWAAWSEDGLASTVFVKKLQ
jgi:hypothetical protein